MSTSGQPFPMSKLLYMYVKRLAQPFATRFITRAKIDNNFKVYFCLPPANLYHFYEAKIKFRLLNIGKIRVKEVPKLPEKDAVVLGANLLSEFLIYSVASAFALNEVLKYKERERGKDEKYEVEGNELLDNVVKLGKLIDKQSCDIRNLDELIIIYKKQLESVDN